MNTNYGDYISTEERSWICNRFQHEIDELKIRKTGLVFPEGYPIDLPLDTNQMYRIKNKGPSKNVYKTLRLWICPICSQIVISKATMID